MSMMSLRQIMPSLKEGMEVVFHDIENDEITEGVVNTIFEDGVGIVFTEVSMDPELYMTEVHESYYAELYVEDMDEYMHRIEIKE